MKKSTKQPSIKGGPKFVHLLVRINESFHDLEFESVVACRLCATLEPKELLEAVTEYAKGFRDDIEEVEELGNHQFTGPSGVVVRVKSVHSLTCASWELFRDEGMIATVCL
jgi:hypothetical protein